MKQQHLATILIIVLSLAPAGATADSAPMPTAPPADASAEPDAVATGHPLSVAAFLAQRQVPAGGIVSIALRLDIAAGWHVNSGNPLQKYLVPTALRLAKDQPATLDAVEMPPGELVDFGPTGERLSVYQGRLWVRARLRIDPEAPPGLRQIELELGSQACNDNLCLPPRTHTLQLALEVGKDPSPEPGHP